MRTIALPTFHDLPSGNFKSECSSINNDLLIFEDKLKDLQKRAKQIAKRAEKAYQNGSKLYSNENGIVKPRFKMLPKMMEVLDCLRSIEDNVAVATESLELKRLPEVKRKPGVDFEVVDVKTYKI